MARAALTLLMSLSFAFLPYSSRTRGFPSALAACSKQFEETLTWCAEVPWQVWQHTHYDEYDAVKRLHSTWPSLAHRQA